MAETRRISDLIVLGRACPEPLRDGRVTVCLGGYSHELGFVRIYPTRTDMPWKRWDVVSVVVEKDARDSRAESWKIAGSRSEWEALAEKVQVVDHFPQKKWRDLVANLMDDCVTNINDERRSLGIIRPTIQRRYFANNPHYAKLFQPTLPGMGESTAVKRDFPHEPRFTYRCSGCQAKQGHDQQVLEWGFYEWIRKNPDNKEQVWRNALLDSQEHDIYFFVGNQLKYRTSFLVISVLRLPKGPVTTPLLPLRRWTQNMSE